MKSKLLLILLTILTITMSISCSVTNETNQNHFTVTDVLNREVTINNNPERFVCVGPNSLRLYTYIGDIEKIAGIENFEIIQTSKGRPYIELYQTFIDTLPIISEGGPKTVPNAENILASNPDVIIMSSFYERSIIDNIAETTNIPVVVITNDTSEGSIFSEALIRSLEIIGIITNNQTRAQELTSYLNEVKADLYQRTKDIQEIKSAYIGNLSKAGHQQITSTSGDYEMFDLVNIINLAKQNNIDNHAIIDKESLLLWDPEIIFIDANGYELLLQDMSSNQSFYESLNAFKNSNVYLQMPYNFYSTNLEVALANAYYCGLIVYPNNFTDINISEKVDEISRMFIGIDISDILVNDFYGGYQQIF